jgi:phenylpyruvate tautomerase PptA (4-oxalocrotonate tautomerase family)
MTRKKGIIAVPQLDLYVPAGALHPAQKSSLMSTMTDLLFKWEGVPQDSPNKAFAWAYVHEVPADSHAIGGKPASAFDRPRYRVVVTVPEGVLNAESKAGLVAEVTQAIAGIEGKSLDETSTRVTCYILDVANGGYGVAGQIYHLPARTGS